MDKRWYQTEHVAEGVSLSCERSLLRPADRLQLDTFISAIVSADEDFSTFIYFFIGNKIVSQLFVQTLHQTLCCVQSFPPHVCEL